MLFVAHVTNPGVELPAPAMGEPAESVRELLALDLSLAPSDRRILERVLLEPTAVSARELARCTGANPQSLYVALDRLERRGLIVRERAGAGTRFRSGHPSAVLFELLRAARRAGELAERIEVPLRRIHESRTAPAETTEPDRAQVATSLTASIGAALQRAAAVRSEVWVIGDERPWVGSSSALEQMLLGRTAQGSGVEARVLVRPANGDLRRHDHLVRLASDGVRVRTAALPGPPMLLLDRRWAFVRTATPGSARGAEHLYFHLDAPDLVEELVRGYASAWSRAEEFSAEPKARSRLLTSSRSAAVTAGGSTGET